MNTRNWLLAILSTLCAILATLVVTLYSSNALLKLEVDALQAELEDQEAAAQTRVTTLVKVYDNLEGQYAELLRQYSEAEDQIQELTDELTQPREFTLLSAAEPTIYDLPLSEDLQRYTYAVCEAYGIVDYYELVLALMWQESNYRADAMSPTNDYGIMQINVINHKGLSETLHITDFLVPEQNIHAGVYMLSGLLKRYDGDEHKALVAYNMGPEGVERLWSNGIYSSEYSRSVIDKQSRLDQYYKK